jgi:uncharacterized membrane protein
MGSGAPSMAMVVVVVLMLMMVVVLMLGGDGRCHDTYQHMASSAQPTLAVNDYTASVVPKWVASIVGRTPHTPLE